MQRIWPWRLDDLSRIVVTFGLVLPALRE